MRRPYQILIPLLSLFLVRVDLTDLFPLTYSVRLLRLLDADTAEVALGSRRFRVRLAKLDAPELGQPFIGSNEDAGKAALRCAKGLLGTKRVFTLRIYKMDIYRRILGDLDDLSFELIRQGCSTLYPYAEFRSRAEKGRFIRALLLAKRKNRGLWRKGGYLQPKLWRKLRKRS